MGNVYTEPDAGIDGSTAPKASALIGGKDGSGNLQDIITDTDGHLQVDILSSSGGSLGGTLTNNQVSVDTTAGGTQIVAADATRKELVVTNDAATKAYIGTGTVSTANGFPLSSGESVLISTVDEVKGITGSGSTTIAFFTIT